MLLNQGESFSEQCALSAHCCACAPLLTAAQGNEVIENEIGFLLIWLFVRLPQTLDWDLLKNMTMKIAKGRKKGMTFFILRPAIQCPKNLEI